MNNFTRRLRAGAAWVWKHTSAGVALVLIIGALVIGYRTGRPASERDQSTGEDGHLHAPVNTGILQMYTCSMHPSVRLPDPDAKCPICFMDLIPVSDSGGEENARRITLSHTAVSHAQVETAPVGRFFPIGEMRLFGKITYDETSVARLTAYFPGRIERLFVNYIGVRVAKGDHMAEVYSPDVLAAFEELRQSLASVRDTDRTSDIIWSTSRDTLQAARERLRLFGLTKEQIDSVEDGTFDSDRLTIFAPMGGVVTHLAVREGDYVQTGAPIATVASLERLWLDMEAYESQLPLLRWGQPVTFTVEAHPGHSFEGCISFIEPMIDERTRTAAVRVAVDNSDGRLKPGMFASAVVRTRVAEAGAVLGNELAGKWVGPMHPTVVREVPGSCDICGMDLVTAESLGVVGDPNAVEMPLVIPRSAVLFTGTRSMVYIEVPDTERPTYESRAVTLGPRAGDFYIVRDGLQVGESVVVHGAFRVDSSMQIAAKPSMMTPGGDGGGNAHYGHGGMSGGNNASTSETSTRVTVPDRFVFALKPVYAAYLDAQESLASDDLGKFQQAASDLISALALVQETGLVGDSLGEWRHAAAALRVEQPVTTIEAARSRFQRMSEGVIALQRKFGHRGSEDWHLAHCPMAFDNKGADWMQRGSVVNNPYFGDMMLRCGDIRETFRPLDAAESGAHDHE